MRSDRDKRSRNEKEIDDFLSQFEPSDDVSADVNDYLDDSMPGNFTWEDEPSSSSIRQSSSNVDSAASEKSSHDSKTVTKNAKASKSERKNRADKAESTESAKTEDNSRTKAKAVESNKANKENKLKGLVRKAEDKVSDSKSKAAAAGKAANKPKSLKEWKDFLFMKDGKVSGKKILRDLVAVFCAIVLCGILYALAMIITAPGINPHELYSSIATSSMIYDDDGKQVDSVFYTENRKIIKYEEMPEDLINSFVAIEDKTFWKHHGFNWTRMIGAVISSLTGHGQISGTSTITQQLARNVYLADTKSVRSIKRKILEMYYAARIEAALSKEEIVEAYLNTIYLGYGCYGVDSAAKAYFSTTVDKLNTIQCAALAALPQAPEDYALIKYADGDTALDANATVISNGDDVDTYVANDKSKDRRDLTLGLMKDQGYIDEATCNKLQGTALTSFLKPTFRVAGAGDYTYFHEYLVDTVINDLMKQYEMSYGDAEKMVYTQGLKIYSTMDSTAQKVAIKELKDSSNYPGVSGLYNRDSEGNIVNKGTVLLYNYENFFNDKGNFTLKGDQVKINSDGSVTIKDSKRLNVYTTETNEGTDYSIEFKFTYKIIDGILYSYPGGYVNVPQNYKSLDADGNVVISADFFNDNPDVWKVNKEDKTVTITKKGYSLAPKTIQPQAAMVIVGVGTGEVKAMVGGRTTKGEKLLNRALNPRQSGSSIKPLSVYGAALQRSFELQKAGQKWPYHDYGIDKQGLRGYGTYITTYSSVADEKTHIEGRDWPKNAEGGYSGKQTFMTAIQKSINTCAVKIQLQIGAPFSAEMLERFGLSTIVTDESQTANDMNPAAMALGGLVNGVIPLEMALAYSSFPAGGKVNTPICYTKVVDRDGKVLLEGKSEQSEVMDEGVAWIMTKVLQSVVTNGIAGGARLPEVQSGGKTGTTDDQTDIWFDGFTPSYAAALWIGVDNNVKLTGNSGYAARLWSKILRQCPKALKGTYKAQPANVIQSNGCYFTRGTEIGLDSYTPEDKKLVSKVEKYFNSHECTIEEACAACGTSYDEYKDAGGKISKGAVSEYALEQEAYRTWCAEREGHKDMVVDKDAWDDTDEETGETIHHDAVYHWEYQVGYRDGDFKSWYAKRKKQ